MFLHSPCVSENVNSNLSDGDVPLFWWSKEQQRNHVKVWEDLVMLLETFEEKQVSKLSPQVG
jgi:beta-mannanase